MARHSLSLPADESRGRLSHSGVPLAASCPYLAWPPDFACNRPQHVLLLLLQTHSGHLDFPGTLHAGMLPAHEPCGSSKHADRHQHLPFLSLQTHPWRLYHSKTGVLLAHFVYTESATVWQAHSPLAETVQISVGSAPAVPWWNLWAICNDQVSCRLWRQAPPVEHVAGTQPCSSVAMHLQAFSNTV